jgi:hypothetical protein
MTSRDGCPWQCQSTSTGTSNPPRSFCGFLKSQSFSREIYFRFLKVQIRKKELQICKKNLTFKKSDFFFSVKLTKLTNLTMQCWQKQRRCSFQPLFDPHILFWTLQEPFSSALLSSCVCIRLKNLKNLKIKCLFTFSARPFKKIGIFFSKRDFYFIKGG